MKKIIRFFSIAALALVGAVMTGCSNDDNLVDTPQQPENKDNVVTLTTTVGFDDGATTRALTPNGEKTFAAGDKIAVIYKNTSSKTVKEVVEISSGGGTNTATFTVTFTNPNRTAPIRYIYPAAMAKEPIAEDANIDDAGTVDFTNLDNQDGTLATLGSNLDLCTLDKESWEDGLPNGKLTNKLAILAIKLKNGSGPEITSSITNLTLSDGNNSYVVNGYDEINSKIYVAIRPTSDADISITATGGVNYYTKSLTKKTYALNNGYNISLKMINAGQALTGQFSVSSTKKVLFSQGNLQATYNGSVWSWAFATNQWDCIGNAAGNTKINGNGTVSQNDVIVDLFGWVGASSTWEGAAQYGISNYKTTLTTDGYGNSDTEKLKSDWGNTIGDGWRTLTKDEWTYVFETRSGSTVSGSTDGNANVARYTYATVNGVSGVILFPDGVTIANTEVEIWGPINQHSSWETKPTNDQWTALAAKGCVFLPAAGYRTGAEVKNVNVPTATYALDKIGGYYWSSTSVSNNANKAYSVFLKAGNQGFAAADDRFYGFSIRLVRDVN